MDEARHRSKQASIDLTRNENESRADIDAERCKQKSLRQYIDNGIYSQDNAILHNESIAREDCALAGKADFILAKLIKMN